MPIDYTSTKPFNNPNNPWFEYTQMHMGGSVVSHTGNTINLNNILDLTQFDPMDEVSPGINTAIFSAIIATGPLDPPTMTLTVGYNNAYSSWNLTVITETSGFYTAATCTNGNPRDIFKYGQMNWCNLPGSGTGFPTISPVLSSVAGWEKRRICGGIG